MVLSLNASPFHREKLMERHQLISARSVSGNVPVAYINLTGGQDELVFDGASFAMDSYGALQFQAPEFKESIETIEIESQPMPHILPASLTPPLNEEARIYEALVTGIRDYVRKNGFQGAVLGLSGGIDSALTLALAADALSSRVWGYETFGDRNYLEAQISRLRSKLTHAGAPNVIETVRGFGYIIR